VVSAAEELRRAVRVGTFVGLTAGILPAFGVRTVLASREREAELMDAWKRAYCRTMLRVFGVQQAVLGAPAPATRARLVVANHRSGLDIPLMLATFGGHMLSRADLSRWPLVGPVARRVGTVFVDRKDKRSGASAIRTMHELLQGGATVCVFPEGTTFADDVVRPFQPGAFLAATRAGAVDVVPVGIAYQSGSGAAFFEETFVQHLGRIAKAPPSKVVLAVGAPIPSEDRRAAELLAEAHRTVGGLVAQARAEVDRS
jgi:1-acyl-sn-glycerol-3-phosphate acyltransferase